MFRFLHAADIHLDSPLTGLDKYEGAPVDEIRNAARRALENLVATAIREQVAFVILAGDIYDGDWRDFNTGQFFVTQMVKLKDAGIPVYAILGNHDAGNKMTKSLPLPGNVTIFSTNRAETVCVEGFDVAIHGQSFAAQCTTSDLARDYPAPVSGCFNIGLLHTSLSGREGHDRYAPCTEESLRNRGYDYWALGHVHLREVISTMPTIAFAGNIQGRHARETGPKGCLLVTVADDLTVTPEFQSLDVFRWERAVVDLSDADDKQQLLEWAARGIREACERAEGLPVAVRLELTGETSLHQLISAEKRQLTHDLRAMATDIGSGNVWLEKLTNSTRAFKEAVSPALLEGPLAEISSLVRELALSPDVSQELGVDFADLRQKLPADLTSLVRDSDPDWWQKLLVEAESVLLNKLKG